ncbi:thiopurine S-methyltransferase [Thiofilum flexile]|uniref:thiopurine S-methyltransferase n=1 Tax=Thiofilum flexile TaxID=125627 RepID=UPI000362D53C|nr:thiopurine S-methyltransferase [Thiofilum flexile]
MEAAFWHARWENNEIGFHQDKINPYLQSFWPQLDAPHDQTVFVPLCGKSIDMVWLRTQGYTVLGVELSAVAVSDFFKERNITPNITPQGAFERWETEGIAILVGDFFALSAEDLRHCGSVYDRASLVALPPELRQQYAEHFMRILPAQASTLLITFEYDQAERAGPPFAVLESEVRALYQDAFQVDLWLDVDILPQSPGFKNAGITRLHEKVYCLKA